jgi:hypothetical protein
MIRATLLALALSAPAFAQTAALPRTPDGHPDFQGVWLSVFTTPFERPAGRPSLVVSEAEARKMGEDDARGFYERGAANDPDAQAAGANILLKVRGDYRTSQIVVPADGKLPLTQKGREIIAAARAKMAVRPDGPEARNEFERCIVGTGLAPLSLTPGQNPRQVVQTSGHVMIYSEDGPSVRVIPFGASRRPTVTPPWGGDSIARWEGEELVVETTNSRGAARTGPTYAFVVRPESRVVERFRLASPDEILYSFTVIDPDMYSQPWRAEYILTRIREPAYEYGCHEGNYAMVNMLRSARAAEGSVTAGKQ